jgi:hypothetical protein|tara:strand:- start:605 stop:871 length:267 start_codon:yes stop_codon:yes gene_type:complete
MKLSDIILENKKITLAYTDPGSTLYSITINGEKQRSREAEDKAIEMIKKITGLEVPRRAMYLSDEVQDIVDALRKKGYEAEVYPMDVS